MCKTKMMYRVHSTSEMSPLNEKNCTIGQIFSHLLRNFHDIIFDTVAHSVSRMMPPDIVIRPEKSGNFRCPILLPLWSYKYYSSPYTFPFFDLWIWKMVQLPSFDRGWASSIMLPQNDNTSHKKLSHSIRKSHWQGETGRCLHNKVYL